MLNRENRNSVKILGKYVPSVINVAAVEFIARYIRNYLKITYFVSVIFKI